MENIDEAKKLDKTTVEKHFDTLANMHKNINSVLDVSKSEVAAHANIYRDYFTKRYIKKFVAPQQSDIIIDFGCGVGRVTNAFAPFCKKIIGLDLSSEMIKVAVNTKPATNTSYIHITSVPFDIEDNSIDKIFTNWVFQHISDNDAIKYLTEFKRILNPSGRIFLFEQTKNETQLSSNYTHVYRRESEYENLIREAGLKNIQTKHAMRVPARGMSLWNKKISKNSLWKNVLGSIDELTMDRKPEFANYYTTLFKAGK